jgi:hypothetical protein
VKTINRCTVKYGRFCSDLQEISYIQQVSFGDLSALTLLNIKIPNIIYNNDAVPLLIEEGPCRKSLPRHSFFKLSRRLWCPEYFKATVYVELRRGAECFL